MLTKNIQLFNFEELNSKAQSKVLENIDINALVEFDAMDLREGTSLLLEAYEDAETYKDFKRDLNYEEEKLDEMLENYSFTGTWADELIIRVLKKLENGKAFNELPFIIDQVFDDILYDQYSWYDDHKKEIYEVTSSLYFEDGTKVPLVIMEGIYNDSLRP